MHEFNTDDEAARFNSHADSFFEATRDARALKAAIMASLDFRAKRLIHNDYFAIAELAVEVIGKGDPRAVLDIYGAGGKIDDLVVCSLDSAVGFARRDKSRNAKDEFLKIAKRHDWSF